MNHNINISERKKVLWVSPFGYPCSYSYVTKDILSIFPYNKYDLFLFCVGKTFPAEKRLDIVASTNLKDDHVFTLPFINDLGFEPEDKTWFADYINGCFYINDILNIVNPDIIINLYDNHQIEKLWISIKNTKYNDRFVPYMPIDCKPSLYWFDFFNEGINKIITMSKYSKNFLNQKLNLDIEILPHIVNKPTITTSMQNTKQKWLGDNHDADFVIGCINCNHYRKRLDILIDSFRILNHKFKNKKMCLLIKTTSNQNLSTNYDFTNVISNNNNIIILNKQYSKYEINELYSCMDVFVTTTTGEGFGLTPCEALMNNVLPIVPKNTSYLELFKDYPGLYSCNEKTLIKGRYTWNVKDELYICIIKSYVNHTFEVEEKKKILNISIKTPTIIISPVTHNNNNLTVNIVKQFNEFDQYLKNINKLNKKYKYYQVLIYNDPTYLGKMFDNGYLKKYLTQIQNRTIIITEYNIIGESALYKNGNSVNVPNINSLIETIEKFMILTKEVKKQWLHKYQTQIMNICNSNSCKNKLVEILDKFT